MRSSAELVRYARRRLRSRWLVIVCSIWLQSFVGASYTFGVYSQAVKEAHKFDQTDLDTLATAKDIGSNVGVLAGILFEHMPSWAVMLIGALSSIVGYLMMWLSTTGRIDTLPLWQMCVFMFLAANSLTFFNTVTVVTCVQNFPRSRGIVIGLMKGVLGLSGAILTQVYHAVYADDPESYILMLTWLPALVGLVFMFVIRPVSSPKRSNESTNLYWISAVAVGLAFYLLVVIIMGSVVTRTQAFSRVTCSVCACILLLPLGVVYKSEREDAMEVAALQVKQPLLNPELTEPLLESAIDLNISGTVSTLPVSVNGPPQPAPQLAEKVKVHRGDDHTISQALRKADFWLLFIAMACGMGSALSTIDNMGQIGASQGYSGQNVATLVSVWCIWNFLGRLGFGTLSDVCLHRYNVARPLFLCLTQTAMAVGHLMFAIAFPGSLYVGSVVVGLCYGAQWSLMPAVTSEIFGLMRFGTLFNTIAIASPVGAYYFSVHVAGYIYDHEAGKENGMMAPLTQNLGCFRRVGSNQLLCHGAHCFRLTFLIMAATTGLGAVVCLWLTYRTRKFYSQVRLESARTGTD